MPLKFRQNSNITCTSFMLKSTAGLQSLFAPMGHPIDGFAREKAGWIPLKWRVYGYDLKVGREIAGRETEFSYSISPLFFHRASGNSKRVYGLLFFITWLSRIVKPPSQLSNVWFLRAAYNFPEQLPFFILNTTASVNFHMHNVECNTINAFEERLSEWLHPNPHFSDL